MALNKRFGLKLTATDPRALMQKLYTARKSACDPALAELSLTPSPSDPSGLWILNKNAKKGNRGINENHNERLPGGLGLDETDLREAESSISPDSPGAPEPNGDRTTRGEDKD